MQVVLGLRIVVCAGSAAFALAYGLQDYFLQLRSFDLRSRMLENHLGIKKIYCKLALALLEGTDYDPSVSRRSNAAYYTGRHRLAVQTCRCRSSHSSSYRALCKSALRRPPCAT